MEDDFQSVSPENEIGCTESGGEMMMWNYEWQTGEAATTMALLQAWMPSHQHTAMQKEFLTVTAELLRAAGNETGGFAQLSPAARVEAFRFLVMLTCFGAEVAPSDLARLEAVNREFAIRSPWPQIIALARAGHSKRATLQMGQLSPDGKALLRQVWKYEGLLGVVKTALMTMDIAFVTPEVARRYANVATLAHDTLGGAFFSHMSARRLPLPGAKGSLPERALQHDWMHVVTGFDTDPRGESRLAGFYAGVTSVHKVEGTDPFTFVMVALMTFHLGYKVGPSFVLSDRNAVSPRELAEHFIQGTRSPRSPLDDWRFQDELALPLTEVRRTFALPAAGALLSSSAVAT